MVHGIEVHLMANIEKYKQGMDEAKKISGDSMGFIASIFDKVKSLAGGIWESIKSFFSNIGEHSKSASGSMSDSIGGTFDKIKSMLPGFRSDLDKTKAKLDETEEKTDGLVKKIGVGLIAALVAATAAISAFVKKGLEADMALANVAISGNLAASQISRFEAVAAKSGVSAQEFGGSMVKLRDEMAKAAAGEGNSFFDKLGIKVVDANNALLKTDEVTIEVAKKIAGMSSEAEKYAAAAKLGFEGKVQVLEDIARAGDLAATTTDDQAAAVVRLGKIWHDILPGGKSMWAQISTFLASNLTPAVTEASVGVLSAKNKIVDAFNQIFGTSSMFPAFGEKIKAWGVDLGKWFSGVADGAANATISLMRFLSAKTGVGNANAPLGAAGAIPGALPLAGAAGAPVVKDADKRQLEEYAELTKTIREKTEAQRMEGQVGASLTEGQRMAIKLTTDLRDGKLHLTDAQKVERTEALSTLIAQEKSNIATANARSQAASAADKETTALAGIISSIKARTEAGRLELAVGMAATDSQKENIKVEQALASGKLKLTDAHWAVVRGALAEQAATEALVKTQQAEKDVLAWIIQSTQARLASTDALAAEYATYGKGAEARESAMIAVKAEAELEKFLAEQRKAGKPVSDEMIAQLRTEKEMRVSVEQATLGQTKALGYATQLSTENKTYKAESISDPRARAEALLQIDADVWQERIRLAGAGTEAQRLLQTEYNTWYANQSRRLTVDVDLTRATEMLKVMEAVDDAAKSAASGMEASFGAVGKSIGGLTTALTGYGRAQQTIAAQLVAATKAAGGDDGKIQKANAAAAAQSAQAQVKSYGDMAGAAKGFFKENSTGYKLMEGAEKAFRAYEMAMAVESMVKKIFFKEGEVAANLALNGTKLAGEATTTAASTGLAATEASAWGITAVVKALASLPFPLNLAAGAATLAAVVAIGAQMMGGIGGGAGGGQSAADVQKAQGTGSVFGDSGAKSDSVRRSIEKMQANSDLLIPINQGMLTSLQSIQASMSGLTNLVVRTTGLTDGANMGIQTGTVSKSTGASIAAGAQLGSMAGGYFGPVGMVIGAIGGAIIGGLKSIWGKTTQNIVDSGLQYGGSVRGLQGGKGFDQYASVDTTKSSWFGLSKSTSNSIQTQGLNAELSQQFGLIFTNLDKSLQAAAVAMGGSAAGVTNVLDSLTLESTKVSLKGLTGTALTDALNSVISKSMDEIAQAAFPQLDRFRNVGEGYAETVMRIAGDYAKLDSILASTGTTFGLTGMASIAARERLIELTGGIDKLASQSTSFAQNFLSQAEQLAPVQKYVAEQLGAMGLAGIDTRDKFKATVLGLANSGALATEAGAQQYAGLLALADAFAKTHAATEDLTKSEQAIADERKDLQTQLNELTMTSVQLLALQRAGIADSNKALFDQVQAAKAVVSAKDVLSAAYDKESAELKTTADRMKAFQTTTLAFADSLKLGSLSTLTPAQKAAEAQRQYEATLGKAKTGDATAQAALQAAATAYLTADQIVKASSDGYAADAAKVQADLAALAAIAGSQATDAEKQLAALDAQVGALIDINASIKDSALTVAQAIANLAVLGYSGMGRIDGSHAGGLARVPFDGYIAELHKDEQVLTANQAVNYRNMGTSDMTPLVNEIKSLRASNEAMVGELKGLRADANAQTGATIGTMKQTSAAAARTTAAATTDAARSQIVADRLKVKTV